MGSISLRILYIYYYILLVAVAQKEVPPDIIPKSDTKPGYIYGNTGNTTTEGSKFQQNLNTVLRFLYNYTPANGYATCLGYGDSSSSVVSETAYAHAGCYNNSNQDTCEDCVKNAYARIDNAFPRTVGARAWINDTTFRCYLRFEIYNFTQDFVSSGTLGVTGPNTSTAPTPTPTAALSPPAQGGSSAPIGVIAGATVGGIFVVVLCIIALFFFLRRRKQISKYQGHDELEASIEGPVVFSYHDLSVATNDFSEQRKLGRGGFGTVYKVCACVYPIQRLWQAVFPNGNQLAVKKLSMQSQQGKNEFINEINIITSIQHRHLARLKGYCVEGEQRLLVYEFFENGSLDRALYGSQRDLVLDWNSRYQIALGVARGLAYLHEESHIQIIHRDIKASNILLGNNLQPKISDFGVSKLFDDAVGLATSTKVAGTVGYLAPEYATRGRLTSKADVFSFGVLVLEIVSGRRCMDPTLPPQQEVLLLWTWSLYNSGTLKELVDKRLGNNYNGEEVDRLIRVAMLCTQELEENRPTMSGVVAMLLRYLELGPLPPNGPIYYGQIVATLRNTSSSSGSIPYSNFTKSPVTVLEAR